MCIRDRSSTTIWSGCSSGSGFGFRRASPSRGSAVPWAQLRATRRPHAPLVSTSRVTNSRRLRSQPSTHRSADRCSRTTSASSARKSSGSVLSLCSSRWFLWAASAPPPGRCSAPSSSICCRPH